jgi:hypothetical protein
MRLIEKLQITDDNAKGGLRAGLLGFRARRAVTPDPVWDLREARFLQYRSTKGVVGVDTFSESEIVFATELDSADIVIALGKLGRGGTEDETVKLLNGIQRV